MCNESNKTRSVRPPEFYSKYLSGKTIDIGGGDDPVTDESEVFDMKHGDAQHILKYKSPESYDTVHSSHCLEHMRNVTSALHQWWKLVKPGGYMITVVPHEDLYEQGIWPPIFNDDHKATFRINQDTTWSPISYDLNKIHAHLEGAEIIETEIHDLHYDHNLKGKKFGYTLRKLYKWRFSKNIMKRMIGSSTYKLLYTHLYKNRSYHSLGLPIDQTRGDALAQIQIVVKKSVTQ